MSWLKDILDLQHIAADKVFTTSNPSTQPSTADALLYGAYTSQTPAVSIAEALLRDLSEALSDKATLMKLVMDDEFENLVHSALGEVLHQKGRIAAEYKNRFESKSVSYPVHKPMVKW